MTTPNQQLYLDFVDRGVDVFAMVDTEAGALAGEFADAEDQRTLAELLALYMTGRDSMMVLRNIDRILAQRADTLRQVRDRMFRIIERFTQDEGAFVSETVGPVQDETADSSVFSAAFIAVLINRVLQRPISGWDAKFDDLTKEMITRDRARIERTLERAFARNVTAKALTRVLRNDFADTYETFNIILGAMVSHAKSVTVDFAMASVGGSVRWVSVLDGKTTAVCRSRSGKIYQAGVGPRPPAHARCRSMVVPYFPGKGEYQEPTYSEWLQRQTPDRVREVLGVTKGNMFLAGTLSLDDMVSARGRELTLKELAAKRRPTP